MRRNQLEWVILVTSVSAIFALVAYLAVLAIQGSPPAEVRVEARTEEARDTPTGWIVPVTVRNAGGEAAVALVIEATATVGGEEESAQLNLDLLPGGSWRDLAIGFTAAPDGDVAFRVVGYETP